MGSSTSMPQRNMPPYVSPQSLDLTARFNSLNDDTLQMILKFVGNKSYRSFGGLKKQCREVYLNTQGMMNETFLYGYATLSVIIDKIERGEQTDWKLHNRVGKGIVLYNRLDVLDWALEKQDENLLKGICYIAAEEGRTNLLEEMWNSLNENKRYIFRVVGEYAALRGKLEVLKWLDKKGSYFNKKECASTAAHHGQLQILEWLREGQCLELGGELHCSAVRGDQLHILKWLREKEVDWSKRTFMEAAYKGNLAVLQWLHDEGCPWPRDDDYRVYADIINKFGVERWLSANGYSDRVFLNYH